ncbi:hypothetical protein V2J09_003677 [Rumex salicifolius]
MEALFGVGSLCHSCPPTYRTKRSVNYWVFHILFPTSKNKRISDALSLRDESVKGECTAVSALMPQWTLDIFRIYDGDVVVLQLIAVASISPYSTYKVLNGVLRYKGHIYIGSDSVLMRQLILTLHETTMGGHSGIQGTYQRLKKLFYWLGMKASVEAFKELFVALGTKLHLSSTYHSQSDGQIERVNQCLKNLMRVMTSDKPKYWATWLSLAEWWYNTNFHTTLRVTPFQALYGYLSPQLRVDASSISTTTVGDWLQEREMALGQFKDNLLKAQAYMKQFANSKPKRVVVHLNLKLCSSFYGPYQVVACIGSMDYNLALPISSRIHPIFHSSQLKIHIGPNATPSVAPPLHNSEGTVLVLPEAILDTRVTYLPSGDPVIEWLIKWVNLKPVEATWKTADHILHQFP